MKVDYPKNIDDEFDAADESEGGLSLMNPTSTSAFIYRIRFAEICREVVDTIPAVFLESTHQVAQTLDYEAILSLDRKLQLFIHSLPYFFPLDQSSIQQRQGICRQRPYIAWQRVMLHLSIHGCICRLHRLFHLEGIRNRKYADSREMCIRSAEAVLDLQRSLDNVGVLVGLQPKRLWMVMYRKNEVLASCQMLEKSKHELAPLRQAIQRNTQTLLAILHNKQSVSKSQQGTELGPIPNDPNSRPNAAIREAAEQRVDSLSAGRTTPVPQ
ncbi:hypothetical protein BDV32DRAFT_147562 [Aspergillus pseudonomiae]|nr:hypothetical protein BDV32DRAFT_147562 [Aspergillus pseudonomiae]